MNKIILSLIAMTASSSAFAISDNAAREIWNNLDYQDKEAIVAAMADVSYYTNTNGGHGGFLIRSKALKRLQSLVNDRSSTEQAIIVAAGYSEEQADAAKLVKSAIDAHNSAGRKGVTGQTPELAKAVKALEQVVEAAQK